MKHIASLPRTVDDHNDRDSGSCHRNDCISHSCSRCRQAAIGCSAAAVAIKRSFWLNALSAIAAASRPIAAFGSGYRGLCLLLLCFSFNAHAFDLQQLSDQLAKPSVIHGQFIQEKHLRALPKPLTSKGSFVLAKDYGLLWLLKTPLQQDYRITAKGIARREGQGWQMVPNKSAGAEQNRLFLAVLQGDSSGLQRDFELTLKGEADQWQLTLTPRSLLLKQVFTQINIDGGQLVNRIELLETQGDSTVLRMQDSTAEHPLSEAEQHDFAE